MAKYGLILKRMQMQIFFAIQVAIQLQNYLPRVIDLDQIQCNYSQDMLGLLPSKFKFSNVTEDLVLYLLKNMNIDKAAGLNNLSGKF